MRCRRVSKYALQLLPGTRTAGPSCSPQSRHCVSAGSKLVSQVVALDMFLMVICWRMSATSAGSSGMCSTNSCTTRTELAHALWLDTSAKVKTCKMCYTGTGALLLSQCNEAFTYTITDAAYHWCQVVAVCQGGVIALSFCHHHCLQAIWNSIKIEKTIALCACNTK